MVGEKQASNITEETEKISVTEKADKPISLKDLPTPVQRALSGEDFRGWTVGEVHHARKEDGTEYYKINIMKDRKYKTVKIVADGTVMDRKKK